MSFDELRLPMSIGGLWVYALSAIEQGDIGCLNYILKTGVTPLVKELEGPVPG